jgi:ketosteroid isomerase-like protein
MNPVLDRAFARELAERWIAAWNSHDLERVLALYADDFEMRSPLIAERGFSRDGVLRGKEAVRPYWGAGIAAARPPIRFELVDAYAGVRTVAIHYRSLGRKVVVEVLELGDDGLVIRGCACHGADAEAAS